MSRRYLLDANIISNLSRPKPNDGVLACFSKLSTASAIPAPVWFELLFGCFRLPHSKKRKAIEDFLFEFLSPRLAIIPYDQKAAELHAEERARLTALGRTLPLVDGQVAAIAKAGNYIVVTDNIKDFEHFAGITLENWKTKGA